MMMIFCLLMTACQKNDIEELDEEISETYLTESEENQSPISLPIILESSIDLSEHSKSISKATSRSRRTLIHKSTERISAKDWFTIPYQVQTMSNPLENKYEVILKPLSGRPDLYIYGYDEAASNSWRQIRLDIQDGQAKEITTFRKSDFKNIEELGVAAIYGNTNSEFDIEVYIVTVDCKEYPTAEQNAIKIFDPVCGCDGKTYDNYDVAFKAGITSWEKGTCDTAPTNDCCNTAVLNETWLKNVLATFTYESCGAEIYCCELNGESVIDIRTGDACTDDSGEIYSCTGRKIAFYGGIGELPKPNVKNCKHLKTIDTNEEDDCVLFEDDFESYTSSASIASYPNWGSHIRVAGPSGKILYKADIKAGKSLNVNNRHGENSSAVANIKGANKDVQYIVSFKLFVDAEGDARIFLYNQNYQEMDAVVFSSPTYKNRWVSVEFAVSQGGNYSELYINGYKQSNWKHRFAANDQLSYVSFHTKNDGKIYDFWIDDFSVRVAK